MRFSGWSWELESATLVEVDAAGWVTQVWPVVERDGAGNLTTRWRRDQYQLSAARLEALREVFRRYRFVELPLRYDDRRVPDAGPVRIELRAGGREKSVVCTGECPPSFSALLNAFWDTVGDVAGTAGTPIDAVTARALGVFEMP